MLAGSIDFSCNGCIYNEAVPPFSSVAYLEIYIGFRLFPVLLFCLSLIWFSLSAGDIASSMII